MKVYIILFLLICLNFSVANAMESEPVSDCEIIANQLIHPWKLFQVTIPLVALDIAYLITGDYCATKAPTLAIGLLGCGYSLFNIGKTMITFCCNNEVEINKRLQYLRGSMALNTLIGFPSGMALASGLAEIADWC